MPRDFALLVEVVRGVVRNQEIAIGELHALKHRVDGQDPPPGSHVIPFRAPSSSRRRRVRSIELGAAAVIILGMIIGLGTVTGPGGRLPDAQAARTMSQQRPTRSYPSSSRTAGGMVRRRDGQRADGQEAPASSITARQASPTSTARASAATVPATTMPAPSTTTTTPLPAVTDTTLLPVPTVCVPLLGHKHCPPDD